MKSLRVLALMFLVGAVPVCLNRAYAQQEVSPDHYDYPAAQQSNASVAKTTKTHHHSVAYRQSHKHLQTAGKRSHRSSSYGS